MHSFHNRPIRNWRIERCENFGYPKRSQAAASAFFASLMANTRRFASTRPALAFNAVLNLFLSLLSACRVAFRDRSGLSEVHEGAKRVDSTVEMEGRSRRKLLRRSYVSSLSVFWIVSFAMKRPGVRIPLPPPVFSLQPKLESASLEPAPLFTGRGRDRRAVSSSPGAVPRALQKGAVTGMITIYENNAPHDQCPGRNGTTSQ